MMTAAVFAFPVTAAMALPMMMTAFMAFAMMVTAFISITVMVTAAMFFTMVMAVVVAPGVGIIFQSSFSKGFCSSIRRPPDTCVKPDPDIRKGHLRAHADTSADQRIRFYCLQEARESAVSASVGVNDLLTHDLAIFDVI